MMTPLPASKRIAQLTIIIVVVVASYRSEDAVAVDIKAHTTLDAAIILHQPTITTIIIVTTPTTNIIVTRIQATI